MSIGHNCLNEGSNSSRKIPRTYQFRKLRLEIGKVKTETQIDIVKGMIETAHEKEKISFEQYQMLFVKLNKKGAEVGEKKLNVNLGPLGPVGIETKGKLP